MRKIFHACCGLGDLFYFLSLIRSLGDVEVWVPNYHEGKVGLDRLLAAVTPEAHYRYVPVEGFAFPPGSTCLFNFGRRWLFRYNGTRKIVPLPKEAILAVRPYCDGSEYIVMHPYTSSDGNYRKYKSWDKVVIPEYVKVVGMFEEHIAIGNDIPGATYCCDLVGIASLLRGSCGFIGTDSSVLNLANALNVPTACLYNNKGAYLDRPCSLPPLINPTPQQVSELIEYMAQSCYSSEYDFYIPSSLNLVEKRLGAVF
jgi:hypothetical protein